MPKLISNTPVCCCSNFLTEAPGQYTGPAMGGLVTRAGPGGGVMVGPAMGAGMQQGARTSEYRAYCSRTQHSKSRHKRIVKSQMEKLVDPKNGLQTLSVGRVWTKFANLHITLLII